MKNITTKQIISSVITLCDVKSNAEYAGKWTPDERVQFWVLNLSPLSRPVLGDDGNPTGDANWFAETVQDKATDVDATIAMMLNRHGLDTKDGDMNIVFMTMEWMEYDANFRYADLETYNRKISLIVHMAAICHAIDSKGWNLAREIMSLFEVTRTAATRLWEMDAEMTPKCAAWHRHRRESQNRSKPAKIHQLHKMRAKIHRENLHRNR